MFGIDPVTFNAILISVVGGLMLAGIKWAVSSIVKRIGAVGKHMDQQDEKLNLLTATSSATAEKVDRLSGKVDTLTDDVAEIKVKTKILWEDYSGRPQSQKEMITHG